jgi:hypothetical protein
MGRISISVLLLLAITLASAFSAEISEIYLDDGSVLRAEVVSLQNGMYTLRSPSLGEFTLEASRVTLIGRRKEGKMIVPSATSPAPEQAFGSSENFQEKIASTQAAIMTDPEGMKLAVAMAFDPEFRKLLEDPEAVAALKSGDTATLMKKPQFRAIMSNPKIQGLADKMKDKVNNPQ